MYFSIKVLIISVVLSLVSSCFGHAIVTTSLETAQKVQRNQAVKPDGLDSCPPSKALVGPPALVAPDGTITLFARHFNNGRDGSTFFNAVFSHSGGDGSFSNPLEFKKNGQRVAQTQDGIDELVILLPIDARDCINGGCTVALLSQGLFGNCVRVISDGLTSGSEIGGNASTDDGSVPSPTATIKEQPTPVKSNAPVSTKSSSPAATPSTSGTTHCRRISAGHRLHARDFLSMFKRFDD